VSYCHHLASVVVVRRPSVVRPSSVVRRKLFQKLLLTVFELLPKTCNFTICSIFSNSGHVGWCTASPDTILKLDTLVMIQTKFKLLEIEGKFKLQKCSACQDLQKIFPQLKMCDSCEELFLLKCIFLSTRRTPRWVIRFTSKLQVKKKMDRRVEPPDTFLEENHPMTISSKFSSY
jgi:hypothetical protein